LVKGIPFKLPPFLNSFLALLNATFSEASYGSAILLLLIKDFQIYLAFGSFVSVICIYP
jgi:hypothetical protein